MSQSNFPSPPSIPWSAEAMPWAMSSISSSFPRVMEFNATPVQPSTSFAVKSFKINPNSCYKRKSDIPLPTPTKQFITEEKMAAHLNGLHISPDYVSHDTTTTSSTTDLNDSTVNNFSDYTMDSDIGEYNIPLTAKDLEEKLKNANRITICDEIKKITENDTILPKALISRIEKPCTALVLWQPPKKITDLFEKEVNRKSINSDRKYDKFEIDDDDEENVDENIIEDQQNNNTSTLDYNYGMDTDMI